MSDAVRAGTTPTPASWNGIPGAREWVFLAVSLAGFFAALPPASWPVYVLAFAFVYVIGVSGLERRSRLVLVLAVLAAFLFFERQLPRPSVPFVMWAGRAIRAFFLLRAIDFALSKPRRDLSPLGRHRVFQFLLFITFLPSLFAGPVTLFNDFYRAYLPHTFVDRRAILRHALKIAWGAVKFFAIAPYTQVLARSLHTWSHLGGDPYALSPRALAWGYMMVKVIDLLIRFSGFTDMAIGVSRILGFQLDENFRFPLLARTPMEYWKSMHISAYRWLMTHVFYPTWDHTRLLLKVETTFFVSMIWHFSIVARPGAEPALQLFSAGLLYGSGVWLVATISSRRNDVPAKVRSRSQLIAIRIAQTAATFVFISFVNLIFHAGLAGRPIAETWSDVRLILGPSVQRRDTRAKSVAVAPMSIPARFVPSDRDHLNELISDEQVTGPDGRPARLSKLVGEKGLIIVTLDTSCQVFQRYAPRIAELEAANIARGLPFLFLDVTPQSISKQVRSEPTAPTFSGRNVRDAGGRLSGALGARTSAEVFVLDARRTLVYRGAIDDQFGSDFSHDQPQRPYLAAALDDLVADRQIRVAATAAPGCALGADSAPLVTTPPITYQHDVSRIIQARCLTCHRQGGAGPFPLDSYDHVVSHGDRIRAVLTEGRMPPWFAAPGAGPWANNPTLTPLEKGAIFSWLDRGAPKGDSADAPIPREFRDGWDIGKPDLVIGLPAPQRIPAQGLLPYRYVSVDVDLPGEQWVQAIQLRPTAGSNLHHVLVFLEQQSDKLMAMPETSSVGGTGHVEEARHGLTSYFALYSPGSGSVVFPPGTAKRLPRRVRLVFQLHYMTTGTATTDSLRMGLVFSKQAPGFEVLTSSGYNKDFVIPPMDPHYPVSGTYEFKEPGLLLSFLPHMHYRGRAFRYELVAPDGTRTLLLDVPRYGFNWQVSYNLATPIPVSKGWRITATGWFDNSPNNPENPDPTKAVKFGMQSTQEMMIGYFDWIPNRPFADRKAIMN
ncbi:MAG: MBOAT family O-acyltransferase [Gemmatimonadaceae bacterium]